MAEFLDCPICLDTISGRAVQCTNGHTFCGTCLDDVTGQSGAIQCPVCRIAMSKRREIRNMFVEKLIKNYDIKRKSKLPDDKPVYKKVHVYKKKDANTYKVGDLYLWGYSRSNKKKIWQRQEDETDVQTKISVDDINEDGNVYVKTSPSKMWTVVKPILPVTPVQPPLLINRKSKLNSEVDILTNTKKQLNSEVEELVNAKKKLEVEIKKLQFNGKKRKKNNNDSNLRCMPKRLKANKHHKKWEQKDEKLLCQLHKIFDKDYYKKWEQISKIFPGRSSKAIQEKYRLLQAKKLERAKKLKLEHKKRERARKRKLQLARAKTVRIERERKLKLEQKKQVAEIERKRQKAKYKWQKAKIEHKRKLELAKKLELERVKTSNNDRKLCFVFHKNKRGLYGFEIEELHFEGRVLGMEAKSTKFLNLAAPALILSINGKQITTMENLNCQYLITLIKKHPTCTIEVVTRLEQFPSKTYCEGNRIIRNPLSFYYQKFGRGSHYKYSKYSCEVCRKEWSCCRC